MIDKVNVHEIISTIDSIDASSFKTDADRYAAKEAVRKLLARLETPFEKGWTLTFETPALVAGLQMCLDLGIWDKWAEAEAENAGAAQTLKTILGWCNTTVEENLLREVALQYASQYKLIICRALLQAHSGTLSSPRDRRR